MKTKLYAEIASRLIAIANCKRSGNAEWQDRHADAINTLCKRYLPHGSGIDGEQCTLDFDRSTPNRLVFAPADFHHMDESGGYDGWSEHTVVVKPSLAFGFDLTITGKDRNGIKDYLSDVFSAALSAEIDTAVEFAKAA